MEALLIAVLGLMLAARPLAAAGGRPAPDTPPARHPHRPGPDHVREREREAELHRRRLIWLGKDLAKARRRGDSDAERRIEALVKAEAARHEIRLSRLD